MDGPKRSLADIARLSKLITKHEKDRTEDSKKPLKRVLACSSSDTITSGAQVFSEESMGTGYRHDVDEDIRMADSRSVLSEDTMMADAPQVHSDRDTFPRQRFPYAAEASEGQKRPTPQYQRVERTELNTMELSPYYQKSVYPRRVCIAENYKAFYKTAVNPATGKEELQNKDKNGRPLPETKYRYYIYSRPSAFLSKLVMKDEETTYAFVIVEEGEPVFAYFDFDLGPEHRRPELHGDSSLNLLGYSMAVIRMLMSQVLCVNLLCFGDGFVVYESEKKVKWSNHVHVGWPFEERISLYDVMNKVESRLSEVHRDGVKAVAPMFFTRFDKNTDKNVETCVVDKNVYTKKRNFRVPYAKKAKEGSPALKPAQGVKLWNRPGDTEMCASESLYMGLSASMILCRNSYEFWNTHTVRKREALSARGDVALYAQDFQCLPVTGRVQAYKELLRELGSAAHCTFDQERQSVVWGGRNDAPPVDTRVEAYLSKLFRLLYDEDWTDAARMARLRGEDHQRVVNEIYRVCRRSPLHTQALLLLIPQVYKTGLNLLQAFPRSPEAALLKAAEYAGLVGGVFAKMGPCSEAFAHLWEFRTSVELSYSNTCTDSQRRKRSEYLHKLGGLAQEIFTEDYALKGGRYNACGCATDVTFLDMFITEVFLWSGQAVYVFEMDPAAGGDDSALVDVLPKTEGDYDDLFKRCIYYTCHRLDRQVESPSKNTRAHGALSRSAPSTHPYDELKRRANLAGFSGSVIPFMTLKK